MQQFILLSNDSRLESASIVLIHPIIYLGVSLILEKEAYKAPLQCSSHCGPYVSKGCTEDSKRYVCVFYYCIITGVKCYIQ